MTSDDIVNSITLLYSKHLTVNNYKKIKTKM